MNNRSNPNEPLAYFITWTCYGTSLHGDERGWHEWGKGERAGPNYAPETVRDQLKSWCTRKLTPHHPGRDHFWTEGASLRYVIHEEGLETAIEYAGDVQDKKTRDDQ